jgi:aldose 1-epimerase
MPSISVAHEAWGQTHAGQPVQLWTLTSASLVVTITTFGARIVGILAPDRNGLPADVTLGYDNIGGYEADRSFFGAVIGRYSNRIAEGRFPIGDRSYQLPINSDPNNLHSGPFGFSQQVWSAEEIPGGVSMSFTDPDGHQGFPGEVNATVRYTLEAGTLRIDFTATTTAPCPVALTNHTYFNLTGNTYESIVDHELTLEASYFTPVNAVLIPTGEIVPVDGTPFDFRNSYPIGARIDSGVNQLVIAGGYDHNLVLGPHPPGELFCAAKALDPISGRALVVHTTEPGVQFYTGNFLNGALGKGGVPYNYRTGFCLETQHFPDSPNHPEFPSTLLLPGETLRSTTTFSFGVE